MEKALRKKASSVLALALLALPGCGGGADEMTPMAGPDAQPGGGGSPDPEGRYFPVDVGAEWTYRVVDTESGIVKSKVQTVEAIEDVGDRRDGVMAYRLRTQKANGQTVSWQEDTGDSLVRHRENAVDTVGNVYADVWYTPAKLRIDESPDLLSSGSTYTQSYTKETHDLVDDEVRTTDKEEQWTVEAMDEVIEVPAGTFTTMRVLRVKTFLSEGEDESDRMKRYWFARGVGKVKEEAEGQTEELVSFSMP